MSVKEIKKELFVHDADRRISFEQTLDYEIHSHWLSFWLWSFRWGQQVIVGYATWKTKRKYKRYKWAKSFSIW